MNSLAVSLWVLVVAMLDGREVAINEPSLLFNEELECRTALVVFASEMFKDLPFAGELYDQGSLAIECIPVELVK